MGISAQQILQSDPEYLRKKLQAEEMQRVNPTGSAAGALGALLGRGVGNITQGRGFFESSDPGLQRVTAVQNIMKNVAFDPNNPAAYYEQVGTLLQESGLSDLAPLAFTEARKLTTQDVELGIKRAKAGVEAREAAQKNLDYYKKNPEQAEFRLAELAEIIKNDPGNEQALAQYTQITRAASEGSIEATQKAEKESVGLEKDKAQLAKYRKDLADAEKFGPAERWQAEKTAALNLLKSYNIDPTKPLNQQTPPIPSSILYGPMGGEITNAYERAVRPDVGAPMSAPSATPAPAPAKAGGSPNLEAQVKASGIPYEPNKYEYRVLANGTVQRRAK
jgi:hypothetical protein